jgi:hypothetical protein
MVSIFAASGRFQRIERLEVARRRARAARAPSRQVEAAFAALRVDVGERRSTPSTGAAVEHRLDLRVRVAGEAVDGDDRGHAELAHVLDVLLARFAKPRCTASDVLGAEVRRHAAVHLQGADRGDDDGGLGRRPPTGT